MSIIKQISKASYRVFTAVFLLTFAAVIATASVWNGDLGWMNLTRAFAEVPTAEEIVETVKMTTADKSLVIGTCDTAGPIEVESSGGTTAPTAYPTLKSAFDAVNAGTHTGSINVEVCGNTTETDTASLDASGLAATSYTNLTIRPVGGARMIEGTISGAIVKLNGADNVTIDGRQGGTGTVRDLTIKNNSSSTGSAAVWLSSLGADAGAMNNVIRNLELACGISNASAGSTFGIIMSGTSISATNNGADNDNNQFVFNRITSARYGIVTRGVTSNNNLNPVVTDNIIGPNAFGADGIGKTGILMQADTGAIVSRNTVQFIGGDIANTTAASDRCGIGIGTDSWSVTSTTTITSGDYTVTKNIIHDVVEERGSSSAGIILGTTRSGSPTNNLVANNFIYNNRSNGGGSDQLVGIGISGGNTDTVVFNSISLTGDMDPAGTSAAENFGNGIRIPGANAANNANFTVADNSIYIDANSDNPAVHYYAITLREAAYEFGTGFLNYNNYYINPSNPQLFTGGLSSMAGAAATTEFATLANWRTALTTPQDANSIQANPQYISNTSNLHIAATSPNVDAGVAAGGVTDDIDEQIRDATPDIGADEIVGAVTQPGTLALSSSTYSVNETNSTVTITVNRTGGSDGAVSVNYSLTDGTATGGAACGGAVDYVNTGGTVNFANGQASQTFAVTICDDSILEGNETFTVTLSNPIGGATIGSPSTATVTITDDEMTTPGTLALSSSTYSVSESAGTVTITVNRTGGTDGAVSVNYSLTNGTATGGASCAGSNDYINTGGTVNFVGGQTSRTFTVPICNDTNVEGNETFTVTLSNPGGGAAIGTPSSATVTIIDDDVAQAGTLALSSPTYSFDEGVGSAIFTVVRTGGTTGTVSVRFQTSNGTAIGGPSCATGPDFLQFSGVVSFADGETSKTFGIPICDDFVVEGDETFNVTLSDPFGGATLGTPSTAVATIVDNDVANQSLQFSSPTYSGREGNIVTITVTRTGGTNGTAGISYATSNGSAFGGTACTTGIDYIATSGMLFFNVGVTTQTFTVQLCPDSMIKPNETINLTLSNPTNLGTVGTPSTAILTIVDTRRRVRNDYDGDGKSDAAVYRASDSAFYILQSSNSSFLPLYFYSPTDIPVPEDYDGDGRTDAAVFRPSNNTWYILQSSTNTIRTEFFGAATDTLVPGDYDGDGKADVAVWRESNGTWYVKRSSDGVIFAQPFGQPGDRPLVGDFDNDGRTELTVIRAAAGASSPVTVYIFNTTTRTFTGIQWGVRSDTFVIGDYDGDGKDDITVYRPSNGVWYVLKSSDNSLLSVNWGSSTDIPLAGDYDGDGRTDFTVWRPSSGIFYTLLQTGGQQNLKWGASTDNPLSNRVGF